jgi:hypothetical protein
MDQIISEPSNSGVKKRRSGSTNRKIQEMNQVDSTQARLNTHELLCAERYKAIEVRMDTIEKRMDAISADVKELKQTNDKQFNEIKALIGNGKDEKFRTMVTVAGTIIVSLLGVMGYLITHLPN